MTNCEAKKPTKETLALGETVKYRGYPIFHEDKREFRIGIYADGLKDAKKIIDWMIRQGCIEGEEQGEREYQHGPERIRDLQVR